MLAITVTGMHWKALYTRSNGNFCLNSFLINRSYETPTMDLPNGKEGHSIENRGRRKKEEREEGREGGREEGREESVFKCKCRTR